MELARVVNSVVGRYSRACWWADPDDLRSEAWIAAMEAHKGWKPDRGPLRPYAWVAVKRAVAAFLIHETSPVSASWHDRHNLIGIGRAQLDFGDGADAPASGTGGERPELSTPEHTWADELLDDERWRVRVLARLLDLLSPTEAEDDLDLLVGEVKRIGRPPRRLLDIIENQRETIAADEELKLIWKERTP